MPKLIFRGASIRFVDLRYDEKSKTPYVRINLSSAFTEPVREAMEWGEPPAGFASAKLDGEFTANTFVLTPNGRELKQHEVQIDAKEIGDFQLHRVKDDGDTTHNELRFQVLTADPLAAAKLREYISVVGKGEAQLRVGYEQQGELEGTQADDGQGKLISEEQAADTAKADEDGPALAPAAVMGGTHQKASRGKGRGEKVN